MRSFLNLILLGAFFALVSTSVITLASDAPTSNALNPDLETFNKIVKKNWKEKVAEKEPLPKIEIGSVQYLPPEVLKASQQEFTFIKITDEIQEVTEKFRTEYDAKTKTFKFAFDQGRSALPTQKAAIGILHRGKIYLVDGHHKVLLSLYLNAETIPVHVLEDWSDFSPLEFRKKMIEQGYAYAYDKNGDPIDRFSDFDEMKDNPNLFLSRLLIQKVKGGIELEKFNIYSVSGAKKPLILKFNEGLPFVEYFIADLLAENDIIYDPEWERKVPKPVRKQIRALLEEEAQNPKSLLRDVILVGKEDEISSRGPEENAKRVELIFKHFAARINCDKFISPTYKVQTLD
jgi:hypothetical protein